MIYYSASTNGFYTPDLHGSSIPSDAVEISEAEHAALLEAQSSGQSIQADANGRPVATPPSLSAVQSGALGQLSAACAAAIAVGFASTVTGTTLTYTLTDTDQANLDSAYQLALMAEARATAWAAGASHAVNDVLLAGGVYYLCTTPGSSGTAAPTWPTEYQAEVVDGSAGWCRAGYLLGTSDGTIWVSATEATALWIASKDHIATCRAIHRTAKAAIKWP